MAGESAFSKAYKKRLEEKKKKVDAILKKNPDNKVVQHMAHEMEMKTQAEKNKGGQTAWDFIDDAYYAARHIYMDGEVTMDKAITELMDALDACRMMAREKGTDGKIAKKSASNDSDEEDY